MWLDWAEAGSQIEDEYLYAVVAESSKSVPQVALNWLQQQPTVSTVVIGVRNKAQLKINLGAVGWKVTPTRSRPWMRPANARYPIPTGIRPSSRNAIRFQFDGPDPVCRAESSSERVNIRGFSKTDRDTDGRQDHFRSLFLNRGGFRPAYVEYRA